MARLSHPNVAQVHEVGEVDEQLFWVVEFVDGETLKTWLGRPREQAEIVAVFAAAGKGLAAAHAAGLVHRDFKPDNVMIRRDGRVVVMDFGLVHSNADEQPVRLPGDPAAKLSEDLTSTGAIMGTPAYMAPEQFLGHATDARTDQFSFCVALWEALYGQRPFVADSFPELAEVVTSGELQEPSRSEVPEWMCSVIQRGVSTDPALRWPSMDVLLDALARDPRWRRRRALAWGAGFVAVLGLATGITTISQARNSQLAENRSALERRQAELAAKNDELASQRRVIDDADNIQRALRASKLAEKGHGLEALLLAIEVAGAYEWPDFEGAPQEVIQALFDVQGREIAGRVATLDVQDAVLDVVFSPDGESVATVEQNGVVSLWDVRGRRLRSVRVDMTTVEPAERSSVCAVVFPAPGKDIHALTCDDLGRVWDSERQLLFSPDTAGPGDNTIWEVWDESTISLPLSVWHSWRRAVIAPSGDQVLATGRDGIMRVWDRDQRFAIDVRCSDAKNEVTVAAFDPSSARFATHGSNCHGVDLWEGPKTIASHTTTIMPWSFIFSPHGSRLAVAAGNTAEIWDEQHDSTVSLNDHPRGVFALAFSPTGNYLASGSDDAKGRLWGQDGTLRAILEGHTEQIRGVAFSPTGDLLVTGGWDRRAILWGLTSPISFPNGEQIFSISPANGHIASLFEMPHQDPNRSSWLWDSDGALLASFEPMTSVTFSPGGSRLITHQLKSTTSQLRDADGDLIASLETGSYGGHVMASFSPDDGLVAIRTDHDTTALWSSSGELVAPLVGSSVVFSESGNILATSSPDRRARVWTTSGELVMEFANPADSLSLSRDGSHLAGVDWLPKVVYLWTSDGTLQTTFNGHHFDFSPNGDRIAIAEHDGVVRIRSLTGELVAETEAHGTKHVAFSPDGAHLVTWDEDYNARIWSSKGELEAIAACEPSINAQVIFSSDGSTFAVVGNDITHLWTIEGRAIGIVPGYGRQFLADGSAFETTRGLWLMPAPAMRRACEVASAYTADYPRVAQICDPLLE